MMKHASNEKKHVPYLNGNPTRTVAISKALALLDISVGIRINYDNRCISNEKKQLILMGNLAGHEKSAIDSYYWRHYIANNIGLMCPYF